MKHSVREIEHQGAKGLIIRVPDANVVDIYITFNAGDLFCDPDKAELAHAMEHMMFTTKNFPQKNAFSIEFEKNGAHLNAHTSADNLIYDYQCAKFELPRILDLVAEQLNNPLFDAAELVTELGNVREEGKNRLSNHRIFCSDELRAESYGHPNYEERLRQLDSFTTDDLWQYYRRTHTTRNARFLVAGDITKADIKPLLDGLAALSSGKYLKIPNVQAKRLAAPLVKRRDIEQIYFIFNQTTPGNINFKDLIAARLINKILTGGWGSRIFGKVRSLGLAYSVGSSVNSDLYESAFSFSGFSSRVNAAAVFDIAAAEIKNVLAGNFSDQELEDVKVQSKGEFMRYYQTTSDLTRWYSSYITYDEYESFNQYPQLIDSISRQEAVSSFSRLLHKDNSGLCLVGDTTAANSQKLLASLRSLWS
jgi:zinc protease